MSNIKSDEKHKNADEAFEKVLADLQRYRDSKAEEKTIEEACREYAKKKKAGSSLPKAEG